MCGIAGFNWADSKLITEMTDSIRHRGPDDSGHFVNDNVSLGHRRLSIIDLSSAGHQPMFDDNKEIMIIYNGEIYNFKEIRDELKKKYRFNSKTDTEMILYAYKEWGTECIKKFVGMFAFAIYDVKKKILFLARDHIGIKPLYYYFDKTRFIFSSTIPPILEHNIKTKPNKKLIRDFLLYNNTDHTDETFFEGVMKFPKGQYAIYNLADKKLEWHTWWDNIFIGDYKGNYLEGVKELRKLLIKSVDRRLISDVPVGTCLSGGIDSSSIACLINKSKRSEIKTFSAVFPGFKYNEEKFMDKISDITKMRNYKILPTSETVKTDLVAFIRAIGEPVPGPAPYSQYKVFQLAKENDVTVLLDGQGADELLAGYPYFYGFYIKGLLKRGKFVKAFKELLGLFKGGHYKKGILSIGFLFVPLFMRQIYFILNSTISKSLYKDKAAKTDFFKEYYKLDTLHHSLKFHLDYKLEQLLKWEDRNSMAHSRESRVPFLDIDIMRLIFKFPEEFIISFGITKKVLRDSMKGIVPDVILARRDKIGFATPESTWLQQPPMNKLIHEWFIDNEPLSKKFIDLKKTRDIIKNRFKKKPIYGRIIWRAVFLETWLRTFKDKFEYI